MKFLHAADLHIDSPLRGLDAYDGAPVERLRGASRTAFVALVDLALERRVDLVLFAGGEAGYELGDGAGLVALGLVGGGELEIHDRSG